MTTQAMLATWSGELFRYDRQSLKLSCWNKKAGADAPASSSPTISAGWSATQSAFFIRPQRALQRFEGCLSLGFEVAHTYQLSGLADGGMA